ncbi:MAG TPA: cob(I)yrinic acid a,c-diamide adenosyltransferase [Flavobacteriales bacterium]|jgi:cob(I)alamin adenosyltransferase|nr:cob(I)yrinic acid a,c-diamide adenosyltransferase [Flavobacteriales bacterium]
MKIYTKTGDKGLTSLIGGTRVSKSHFRIDAYGTLDELNSWVGLLRDHSTNEQERDILYQVQEAIFVAGSHLAKEPDKEVPIPAFPSGLTETLEAEMDRMDAELPSLRNFILPGGHPTVSYCHISRTICRRAERHVVEIESSSDYYTDIIVFLNRLSDYFFMLARFWSMQLNIDVVTWIPRK